MKTKLALFLVLVIALMSSSIISPLASVSADAGLYPYLRILESSNSGLRIQFEPPKPQVSSKDVNGSTCQQVEIEGLIPSSDLELPPLPVQGVMLGIPADAQPQVRILAVESARLTGSYELCPQELPFLETQADGSAWQAPVQSFESARDAHQPLEVVEMVETGFIRSQAYLQLRLNPVQYNPASGEVKYVSRIEFAVDFGIDTLQLNSTSEVIAEGAFEQQLEAQLLNYDQAIKWREQPTQFAAPTASLTSTGNYYKVQVDQDGIQQLTYEKLLGAGLPVGEIDPNTFELVDRGNPIALRQLDDGDALFESGESVLFYGQILNGVYGKSNVYWLTWGGEAGSRMQDLPGTPSGGFEVPQIFLTTRHFEQNKSYYSNKASGDLEDNWYWGTVYSFSPITARQFKVNFGVLPEAGAGLITVKGLLCGYMGAPFNRAKIYLNGTFLGNVDMPPNTWDEFLFPNIPQSLLVAGENIIEVQTPLEDGLTSNAVLVNWFEVTYNDAYTAELDQLTFYGDQPGSWQFEVDGFSNADLEVYDLSDPTSPRILSGFIVEPSSNGQKLTFEATIVGESHYLAQTTAKRFIPTNITADTPSSWSSASNSADYLVISHASLIEQAQDLATYRSGQGYLTAVIDVQDIYDEFSDGELSPLAIQDFMRFAYAYWGSPKPAYLVLFGDGHFDYFNNYLYNETNFIPAFIVDVDPFQGEVAADNRYAMVSGTDILPDLHVGRLPVRTAVEAAAVVQKIINYETNEPVGWNEGLTFVADNADDAGPYPTDTDSIIATYVPASYSAEKIYYGITHPTAAAVKTALLSAINNGRLIVHYAGHSGIQKWGDENFLALADVLALNNGDKLPFVLPMTCLEGNFSYPSPSTNINFRASIGESFVRKTVGGAIASWSPTGLGLHSGHMILEANLMDNLFNGYHNQVGYLTTEAKYNLFATTSGYRDLMDSYVLFGDPALRLQTIPVPLEAPISLTAAVVSWDKISLSWTDNSTTETSFRIERSLDGETGWQKIAEVGANVSSYIDTDLDELTPYYYRVRAFREADWMLSEFSNIAFATTLSFLDAPSDLAAAAEGVDKITLTWTDNSDSENSFRIERSPDGLVMWEQIAEVASDITTYTDTGLTDSTPYFYRVRAYREVDTLHSEYSNTATTTTFSFLVAPSNLVASTYCGGNVWLSWQDSNLDESAFQVEKSPNGADSWELLAELAPETTTYQDTLLPGSGGFYRVRAYREADQMISEYSDTVFAFMNYCSFLPQINGGTP